MISHIGGVTKSRFDAACAYRADESDTKCVHDTDPGNIVERDYPSDHADEQQASTEQHPDHPDVDLEPFEDPAHGARA